MCLRLETITLPLMQIDLSANPQCFDQTLVILNIALKMVRRGSRIPQTLLCLPQLRMSGPDFSKCSKELL